MSDILNLAAYIREIEEELGEEHVAELWDRWNIDPLGKINASWESYLIGEYEQRRSQQ